MSIQAELPKTIHFRVAQPSEPKIVQLHGQKREIELIKVDDSAAFDKNLPLKSGLGIKEIALRIVLTIAAVMPTIILFSFVPLIPVPIALAGLMASYFGICLTWFPPELKS